MKTLLELGWNAERADAWKRGGYDEYLPARVVADYGRHYRVAMPDEIAAQLSGALAHKLSAVDMPKIGDWVAISMSQAHTAIIEAVLPRTSEIIRGKAGKLMDKQVIAANVDLAFIVQPLDHDFSVARLERYQFQLASQGVRCIILLNKADQSSDAADKQAQLAGLGVESVIFSALKDTDMSIVEQFIAPGQTIVIMGSSGAGKSTLTNRLLGEQVQATQEIRQRDSKGRHTTVHRELFLLPGGGMIIDTPGVRELQLWGDQADLDAAFPDVAQAIGACHYPNCSHTNEDRCAVNQGLRDGTLDRQRYATYLNFQRELKLLEDHRGQIDQRRSQQSKAVAKRRRNRSLRSDRYDDESDY